VRVSFDGVVLEFLGEKVKLNVTKPADYCSAVLFQHLGADGDEIRFVFSFGEDDFRNVSSNLASNVKSRDVGHILDHTYLQRLLGLINGNFTIR